MPPKVKATPAQVEARLRRKVIIPCVRLFEGSKIVRSHIVNVFGECECGAFKETDEPKKKKNKYDPLANS